MTRIAILDDDPVMLEIISKLLRQGGYDCVGFTSGRQLIRSLHDQGFDLFMLDWNVPDLTGINVLAWIRTQIGSAPPVLLVTSRSCEEDIVSGLHAGADDFVTKPFQSAALLARVEALLRRSANAQSQTSEVFGIYKFDLMKKEVSFDGRSVQLNAKELAIALLLFRNRNSAIARAYICETIWGTSANKLSRTIDVHVSRIKAKLELRAENGFWLTTVYGYGYRLEAAVR